MSKPVLGQPTGTLKSRSFWILIDQAVSSAYGLLVGVAAAQMLDAKDFAVYATLFSIYLLGRGAARALALEPLLITGINQDDGGAGGAQATAVSLTVGVVTGGVAIVLAALSETFTGSAACAFLLAVACLLWIDALRTRYIARGRPAGAVMVDVILLLGGTLGFIAARSRGGADVTVLFGVIAVSAIAAVALCERRRPVYRVLGQRQWWARTRPLAGPLLLEFIVNTGISAAGVFLLAAIHFEDAGAMRASQLVAAPMFALNLGLAQLVLIEGVRLRTAGAKAVVNFGRKVLLAMVALGAAFVGVVAIWIDWVQGALGATGPSARALLVPYLIGAVLTAPSFTVGAVLRALGAVKDLLRARIIVAIPLVGAVIIGALTDGAHGVALWVIGAQLLTIPAWLLFERRAVREAEAGGVFLDVVKEPIS